LKILVIRFSSLGDVILTTPLLKALRKKFTQAEIHYCVFSSYADILRHNPNIDRLIGVRDKPSFSELRELKKKLKREGYDLILDAHNNLRTFYLRLFMPGEVRKFKKYWFRKFLLVKFKINLMKRLPGISVRQLSIINYQWSMVNGESSVFPEIFTDDNSKSGSERKLKEAGISGKEKLICIVAGAGHFTKTYPAEYFAELINKFEPNTYHFVLTGKGTDMKNVEAIKSGTGRNVYDLCDKLSLLELAEVMRRCSLVITGDTGAMHIAEAVGVPIVMIAGSSVREFGFFPVSQNSIVIANEGLPCRPCSHIGKDACPQGHFKCMMELKPEIVYGRIKTLTQSPQR